MKFLSLLISMLCCLTAIADNRVSCNQGDQNQQPPPTPSNTPLDDVATSGGVSVDPNEIIGPAGYDSVRWVSINDVLNYTILFENDPEFATANAQKVDVRFRFEGKLVLSRNKQY